MLFVGMVFLGGVRECEPVLGLLNCCQSNLRQATARQSSPPARLATLKRKSDDWVGYSGKRYGQTHREFLRATK